MNPTYKHPYRGRPDTSFWAKAVARVERASFDPIVSVPFQIGRQDAVVTAGSCFAQHISHSLKAGGFSFLQTEAHNESNSKTKTALFSARYGNIYTCRQFRQLFERAYSIFEPVDIAWRRQDGKYIDPFRPQEFPEGFDTIAHVVQERKKHLIRVREVFEKANVFVFTLGLTESWIAESDGAALPLPPGVLAAPEDDRIYRPLNQDVETMRTDLLWLIDQIREFNRDIRFVLTVSPVPLIATFENRHVLVSNTYSKAALRVVAHEVSEQRRGVMYFPSFEIISAMPKLNMFESDYRSVSKDGVEFVMGIFRKHCLIDSNSANLTTVEESHAPETAVIGEQAFRESEKPIGVSSSDYAGVVCDEEMLGKL